MRKPMIGLLGTSLLLVCGQAAAGSVALGVKGGTLGLGLEATVPVAPHFNLRGDISGFTFDRSDSYASNNYDADLDVLVGGVVLDFHPLRGGFHLSGGLYANGSEISAQSTNQGFYTINGTTYSAAQVGTLRATIDTNGLSPYLGLGWGNAVATSKRIGINFDLGLLYQGSPEVKLTADGTLAANASFQNELKKEEANIENDISGFKYYPVASVGVSYRF